MSKTPRTDEAMFATAMNRTVVVHVKFAQQLETELADKEKQLAEARAENERKDKLIEQMRGALSVLVASATPSGPLWHGSAEMQIAKAALSAAESGN